MLRQLRLRQITFPLVWDVIMVSAATINVGLIVFDFTYLNLRPFYFRYAPYIVRLYDEVKGIEPNPVTEGIMEHAAAVGVLLAEGGPEGAVDEQVEQLRQLSRRMIGENPFERSGQSRNLEIIKRIVADTVETRGAAVLERGAIENAFVMFWTHDRGRLARHLGIYRRRIEPLLAVNYYRGYDLGGTLEDHFWEIDLPFLVLFWIEFVVRWGLAVRRRSYPRWFFFPIVSWYDLLGLVPYRHFRFFRLFRVVSIYVRLRRSALTGVGDDIVSRTAAYVSGVIAEEVSDLVAIRILTELQGEVRHGTHLRILGETLTRRRGDIETALVRQVRAALVREDTQQRLRAVYALALDAAVEQTEAMRRVPLPAAVLRPLVRYVGTTMFEAVLETVVATLESDEGREAVVGLVKHVVDDALSGERVGELDDMSREVAIELLEHMKKAVAVKKWMGSEARGGAAATVATQAKDDLDDDTRD